MTDNAANMKKAFCLPGYEIDFEEEEQQQDDMCDDEEWMTELESHIQKRGSCSAHTLQLVVKDGLKVVFLFNFDNDFNKNELIEPDHKPSPQSPCFLRASCVSHCVQICL